MYPWIELTECSDIDASQKVMVNVNHIRCFSKSWHGDTYIGFGFDDEMYVTEPYEKVKQMIADAYAGSCMIVSSELKTKLETKTKQLDGIMEHWKNGGGCPPTLDKECGDFETCEECMRYFLDQVGKQ